MNDSSIWKAWGYLRDPMRSPGASLEIRYDLWDFASFTEEGLARRGDEVMQFESGRGYPWIRHLLNAGGIRFQRRLIGEFIFKALRALDLGHIDLPPDVELEIDKLPVLPLFYLKTQNRKKVDRGLGRGMIEGLVWFRVNQLEYPSEIHQSTLSKSNIIPKVLQFEQTFDRNRKVFKIKLSMPNREMEAHRVGQVREHTGVIFDPFRQTFTVRHSEATEMMYALLRQGWEVWAENLKIQILQEMQIQVTSDQNWFELDVTAGKPSQKLLAWQLIHFLKKKALFIQMGDGSLSLLPERWYEEFKRLLGLRMSQKEVNEGNEDTDENWRFATAYAFALSGLADSSEFKGDEFFEFIRREISGLQGLNTRLGAIRPLEGAVKPGFINGPIPNVLKSPALRREIFKPMPAAPSFRFKLRPYQEYGLSWMHFLGRTRLGGCLADDMGLGKTVQLLAYVDQKRPLTLLVCPKSLVHHWAQEAAKAAPEVKMKELRASDLQQLGPVLQQGHLFIISYGLARIHAEELSQVKFDLIVLDEAQIIKNAGSQVSIAIKKLNGTQRLALTGTPIANHLGELFSSLEFLNPGLQLSGESHLASLRPLILRRMKSEILKDLPEKTETNLILPMEDRQRELYLSVKNYYQDHLRKPSEGGGIFEPSFFLEGLLRLRQIACHPGLIAQSESNAEDSGPSMLSNKFEFLIEKLQTLVAAGHKAIVFSQFTSLLRKFKPVLEESSISYEYLDGQSQDRMALVQRFQEKASIFVLLAGIKTGGLGLNLTAADYCFILDPWWNSAIEQQAVDRIYRIGQEKNVFIYKIVSQDTVEEKILLLHQQKRQVADKMETADEAFLKNLSGQDFQFLFQ